MQLQTLFSIFKFFGFIPSSSSNFSTSITSAFIIAYWIGLASVFAENELTSDRLNVMTNWIQLLINSLTFTIILTFPMVNAKSVGEIFMQAEKFDMRVAKMGLKIEEGRLKSMTNATILFYGTFMCYLMGYELYVVVWRQNTCSIFYWSVTVIPYIIYSSSLCFSFCLLLQILARVSLVTKILESEAKWDQKFIESGIKAKSGIEQAIRSQIPSVFHLYSEILELSKAVEKFVGPFFLAAFTSIFVVTTTQIYYCYVLIVTNSEEVFGYSIWSIVLCVNIIVGNLTAMIAVISISERVGSESQSCTRLIMKMRLSGSRYFTYEDIQTMTAAFQFTNTEITFSAMGFFSVNFTMLCGMISSITTYLIIYIQFHSLYNHDKGSIFHHRGQDDAKGAGRRAAGRM